MSDAVSLSEIDHLSGLYPGTEPVDELAILDALRGIEIEAARVAAGVALRESVSCVSGGMRLLQLKRCCELDLSIGGDGLPGGAEFELSSCWEDAAGQHPGPPFRVSSHVVVHCDIAKSLRDGCFGVHNVWSRSDNAVDLVAAVAMLKEQLAACDVQLRENPLTRLAGSVH